MNIPKLLQKGFTLIELVIVIAIIAILAIGVIAALNPGEQRNRAKDATGRSSMGELMSAVQRWTASSNYSPFCSTATTCGFTRTTPFDVAADDTGKLVLGKLTGSDEINNNFLNASATERTRMYATANIVGGTVDTVVLCFYPNSKALRQQSNLFCDGTTTMPAGGCTVDAINIDEADWVCITQ